VNQGAWTQCVYEVSDAPRYCGTGKWTYTNNVPSWTSDLSWRPLPRREYTKRSDYNALAVVNRHTLTPNGWTHEQFNTKVQRNADGSQVEIAREFGFNDYVKTTEVDFTPARLLEGHRRLLGQGAPALGRLPRPGPGRAPEDQDRRHGDDHSAVHPGRRDPVRQEGEGQADRRGVRQVRGKGAGR
jgi:hypothetical protein